MNNERNLTSESCPWNNKQGLGQQVLQRHQQVVRQPLSSFGGVPKRLGHDRISLFSDIHSRHNSDNFSSLKRPNLPLVNFFYLGNQQSRSMSGTTPTQFSSSGKDSLQHVNFDSQFRGGDYTTLKNQGVVPDRHTEAIKKQTPDGLRQIIAPESDYISGSTTNRTVETASGIPAGNAQNTGQVSLRNLQIPVPEGSGRIKEPDVMRSEINSVSPQHESNVQGYPDNSAKSVIRSLQSEVTPHQLASLNWAVSRSFKLLPDNINQSLGIGQQSLSRQNIPIFRKRMDAVQVPGISENKASINASHSQQPIAVKTIHRLINIDSDKTAVSAQDVVRKSIDGLQNKETVTQDNPVKISGSESFQTGISSTRLVSPDRAINLNLNQLPGIRNKIHDIGIQSHSPRKTAVFRKRLDVAQISLNSASNALLRQQPITSAKINRTGSTVSGYRTKNTLGKIAPSSLTALDRAVNRTVSQLSDYPYQSHGIGQQIRSRQAPAIFRKRFDAQVPEISKMHVSVRQQPMADTGINNQSGDTSSVFPESNEINAVTVPNKGQHTQVQAFDGRINKKDEIPSVNETVFQQHLLNVRGNHEISKPGDQQLQTTTKLQPGLNSMDRAIQRKFKRLPDNTSLIQGLGQPIHNRQNTTASGNRIGVQMPGGKETNVLNWQQLIAATKINGAVNSDSGIAVNTAQNEAQAIFNDLQDIKQGSPAKYVRAGIQPRLTETAPTGLTLLDRAINRTVTQLPKSSDSKVSSWPQPLAARKVNRKAESGTGILPGGERIEMQALFNSQQVNEQGYPVNCTRPHGQSFRAEILPSRMTSPSRAISRTVNQLPDNINHSQNLGHQLHSQQNAIIFRKSLDAAHMPVSSDSNFSLWQHPIVASKTNRKIETGTGIPVSSEQQNEVQMLFISQQANEQGFSANNTKSVDQPLRTEIVPSRQISLNQAIHRTVTPLPDNANQSHDLGQQIHSLHNAIIFRKREDASQKSENFESIVSSQGKPLAARTINRALDTDSGTLRSSGQKDVNAPRMENTAEDSTITLLNNSVAGNRAENSLRMLNPQNNTSLNVLHRHLSSKFLRRKVSTPGDNYQSDKAVRRIITKDLSKQVSSTSYPLSPKAQSTAAQPVNPGIIQKKPSEFDSGAFEIMSKNSSIQFPLAENFNIQRKSSQPVIPNEENSNILYRQEAEGFNPENLLTDLAPASETEEAKAEEAETIQPSADELVDKVWRKLMRKLAVEQERFGGSAKWL